ncbi:MAG: beta-galactosidase trimerization domain-containing protein, partial [Oscillospiraceae bacterium]|nr:beta-galactosidase trimerization domain-containing protein [Oscillospiraceae bacterium]
MRGLKHAPFLLMESCPSATNWQKVSKLKRPGILRAQGLQAVAHGADSVLYFQIRQSQGGAEKFHGAVINHYGKTDTRVFCEVQEIGNMMEKLAQVKGAVTNAKVAVVYDIENRWALEQSLGPRNSGMPYKEMVLKTYKALRKLGLDVEVITQKEPLDSYKLVAAPMLYLMQKNYAEKLREFVKSGGQLFTTVWSGVVDENDRCFLGGTPHNLLDVLGLREEEVDALYEEESNMLSFCEKETFAQHIKSAALQDKFICDKLCGLPVVTTATPLLAYEQDFYAGKPAATVNCCGKGKAWYLATNAEQACFDILLKQAVAQTDILLPIKDLPLNVCVNQRETPKYRYLFLQNWGEEKTFVTLPEGDIIYSDAENNGALPKGGGVVLRISR